MNITKFGSREGSRDDSRNMTITENFYSRGLDSRSRTLSEERVRTADDNGSIKVILTQKNKNKLDHLLKKNSFNKSLETSKRKPTRSRFQKLRTKAESRTKVIKNIGKSIGSQRKINTQNGQRR